MDNDDKQVGKLWSRRKFIALCGATGGVALIGSTAYSKFSEPIWSIPETTLPPCVARPEQTEGPYFVDEKLNRSDIRLDTISKKLSKGTPLEVEFRVSRIENNSCKPLANAMVDIWHCDAQGVYSDVKDWQFDTTGQNFLRGYQLTDSKGIAKFTTVFPGWYRGRAVHIHFKIRNEQNKSNYEFTSQLYFDEKTCDSIYAQNPYSERGLGYLKNERDGIYRGGGSQTKLNLEKTEKGYKAVFEIGVQTAQAVRQK